MGEKGTGDEGKAAFVPYELFIHSSNELTISNSNNLSGSCKEWTQRLITGLKTITT